MIGCNKGGDGREVSVKVSHLPLYHTGMWCISDIPEPRMDTPVDVTFDCGVTSRYGFT